ncbi:MAG TPA: VacJ family lipoprotein [Burkholderiaceae bacterium]|nr:VacJ family lipoprotein [Burkholderiaceae bacterium]
MTASAFPRLRAAGAAIGLGWALAAGAAPGSVGDGAPPAPVVGRAAAAHAAPPGAAAAASPAIGPAGAFSAGSAARESEGPPEAGAPSRAGVDPFERLNRGIFRFNEAADAWVLRPVARVYDRYTPEVLRLIAGNFLSNLLDPWIAVNNLLQGKPADAASDLGRFVFNTTLGFFGFGDPATDMGLEKHREDFGQTLGVWGLPTGPYLVLPLFGPSNVRDGVGFGVDAATALISQFENVGARNALVGLQFVDTRARLLPADRLLADALDRYLLVRDSYLQRRRNLVFDGDPPEDDDEPPSR